MSFTRKVLNHQLDARAAHVRALEGFAPKEHWEPGHADTETCCAGAKPLGTAAVSRLQEFVQEGRVLAFVPETPTMLLREAMEQGSYAHETLAMLALSARAAMGEPGAVALDASQVEPGKLRTIAKELRCARDAANLTCHLLSTEYVQARPSKAGLELSGILLENPWLSDEDFLRLCAMHRGEEEYPRGARRRLLQAGRDGRLDALLDGASEDGAYVMGMALCSEAMGLVSEVWQERLTALYLREVFASFATRSEPLVATMWEQEELRRASRHVGAENVGRMLGAKVFDLADLSTRTGLGWLYGPRIEALSDEEALAIITGEGDRNAELRWAMAEQRGLSIPVALALCEHESLTDEEAALLALRVLPGEQAAGVREGRTSFALSMTLTLARCRSEWEQVAAFLQHRAPQQREAALRALVSEPDSSLKLTGTSLSYVCERLGVDPLDVLSARDAMELASSRHSSDVLKERVGKALDGLGAGGMQLLDELIGRTVEESVPVTWSKGVRSDSFSRLARAAAAAVRT